MTNSKKTILCALLLSLSGCVTAQPLWSKQGASYNQMIADRAFCQNQSNAWANAGAAASIRSPALGLVGMAAAKGSFDACMKEMGWVKPRHSTQKVRRGRKAPSHPPPPVNRWGWSSYYLTDEIAELGRDTVFAQDYYNCLDQAFVETWQGWGTIDHTLAFCMSNEGWLLADKTASAVAAYPPEPPGFAPVAARFIESCNGLNFDLFKGECVRTSGERFKPDIDLSGPRGAIDQIIVCAIAGGSFDPDARVCRH